MNIYLKKYIILYQLKIQKKLELISYSTDFEAALLDALKTIFPLKRSVGCYFHYCKNVYVKAKNLSLLNLEDNLYTNKTKNISLLNKEEENCTDIVLKEFYKIPFIINNLEIEINDHIDNIFDKAKIKDDHKDKFIEFKNYYITTWGKFLKNGILNYIYLIKEQRSNSYLENYNRLIKQKLSTFLYGRNKCKISWPLFLYFIINEENEYRN